MMLLKIFYKEVYRDTREIQNWNKQQKTVYSKHGNRIVLACKV